MPGLDIERRQIRDREVPLLVGYLLGQFLIRSPADTHDHPWELHGPTLSRDRSFNRAGPFCRALGTDTMGSGCDKRDWEEDVDQT